MFGVASIVCFFVSLLFQLWNITHEHVNWQTFLIAGALCLAIHITTGGWWGPLRRS